MTVPVDTVTRLMWTPKPAIELSSQRAVRRHNLSVVLRQVVERGPRSRATIATDTGLNKSTVSSLVSELMDFGLLVERGAEHRGTAGRPGLVVDVARDGVVALGLEVNVDYVAVQATDLAGGSRYKGMEAADNRGRSVDEVLDRLGELARGALLEVQAQGLRPIGATIAVPGLVDISRGELLIAPNLHWSDVPLVEQLRERIAAPDLQIGLDNEANLAALAELWEGAATGISDFMYCSGEIGVGGGLVLGGELFRGYRGFGGEFGHTTVEHDGLPCACGSRGCLETRAGLEPLLAAAGIDGNGESGSRGLAKAGERARAAREGGGAAGHRGAGGRGALARDRARHRRQPHLTAGDRPRRALRADERVARTGHLLRAGDARAGRQRRRSARAVIQPRGRSGHARRRRDAAAPPVGRPDTAGCCSSQLVVVQT